MAGASTNQVVLNGATTGTPGAGMQAIVLTVPATGSIVIPPGMWNTSSGAGTTIQIQTTTSGTWVDVVAAATGGFVYSDGVNAQLANSGTTATTITLYGPNGGTTAPQTFKS